MHRRSLGILGIARDEHGQVVATTSTPLLSDEDRDELRPILRAYAVQQAALSRSRWWWGYGALRVVTAIAVLATPVIGLVAWIGASGTLWAALSAYVLFGGVALLGHGVQQSHVHPYLFVTAAAIVGFGTAVAAVFGWLWHGAGLGLAATGVLLALAEIRLFGLIAVRSMVFYPLARRRAGWLLPPQSAAVHLLQLVDGLHRARATCRHPRFRRNFLRWMDRMIKYMQWDLPKTTAELRLGAAITADTRTRANQLAGRLRRLHVRLAHDHQLQEYDRISVEAATLTMALARGDWSWVTPEDETAAGPRRVVRVLKRLVPSAVLLATAIGLPFLPGVSASSASLTGIQVGLGLAAVLSLIPVEATHREDVMSAYANATKRNS